MASQEASPSEGLGEEDLGKLCEALHCVRTSYKHIGLQIGVKKSEIESAEKQETDPGDRLLEILSIRVKKAKVLTWKDIVEALRSQCVGEGKVADEIQKKYGLAAASEGTTSKEHEKQAQLNEREGEKSKQSTEGDPPMNKEKVSGKQDSDSEGEGSERVKQKVYPEKPRSKAKRKGEKVKKKVGKTQKCLEVVESNDENLNERKRKRRSKQKGEPPLYQEEVSYKQDSDSEGEGSERVKRKIHSEKPRSKTTRKGEKVREKAEMSVACSPQQEVELAQKKEGNVQKKESFKQGEKERGTEKKLQRNKKAVREKDENFGKETVSDSHTEQEVTTQTQAVIVESDDEYFTASSGAEMESTQFQNKTTKEASPQYAKGESHLKGAMKRRRRKDKYSSAAAAAGEDTESEDESSYARVSKEEEGSKAQTPEPRRKPMPKVRTPKPVHTETIGSSWSKVSKRSNEKAEQSAPSSMYHSKGSRPKDRAQKVEKGRGIPPENKAAVVPLELASDDRSQEECEEEQEWDSDERSEEGDEDSEQEETGPGSENNELEKKRGRGIRSEKKATAVPLEPTSVDSSQEESGEETRDLDDRSEDEDSEQKLSSEEEEARSDGESSAATSEEEENRIAAQPERRKHVKGKTSTGKVSATASRYDVPERSDPSPRGGGKGAKKKKKKKKIKHKEREMDQSVKPSSSLSTSPEERPKQPTSMGQRRKTGQREGKKGKSEKRRRRAEGLMVMSSSETDDSSSPECDISKKLTEDEAKKILKVFKRFFGKLCYGIVNPAEISAQLQEKHLISQETMIDMLRSPESQQEKTIHLVLKLSKRLESRPYRMYRFIEVLLGNSVLQGAGREILRETGM